MALSSMTGFARAQGEAAGCAWHWELRSVNGKALDIRCRLPQGHESMEQSVREIARGYMHRGNLQVSLQVTMQARGAAVAVNEEALDQILAIADKLRKRLNAPPVTVEGLLGLRGILESSDVPEDEAIAEQRRQTQLESLKDALLQLVAMRRAEGEKLQDLVSAQLSQIASLAQQARDCPARSAETIRQKLTDQVAKLMETGTAFEADRLHAEAVMIAARADIQEELDRIDAHVAAGRDLLDTDGPVGRKFDFLAQEFNREANTLCSKSSDTSLTQIGLELKSVIDQLREQVQNIE